MPRTITLREIGTIPEEKTAARRHDHETRVRGKSALRAAVAEVNPPTLAAVAERLEVSTGFLRYWFADEVAALRAVHQRRLAEARELRRRRDADLIEATVRSMVQEGVYPGRKRFEAALREAGTSLLTSSNLGVYRTALLLNVKR